MSNTTIVDEHRRVQARYEQVLDALVKIEITDDPDEARRYRATLDQADPPVPTMQIGDTIGWGRTPARARRRAVDRIANRRRGPSKGAYRMQGVTFSVGKDPDPSAPHAQAYIATVLDVEQESPVRHMASKGMVLARMRGSNHAADRAVFLLGQWAERARLDTMQQRLVTVGEPIVEPSDPPRWDDGAFCRQTDPDAFFPDESKNAGSQTAAISICERCPVRVECLARALDQNEAFGVWGGTTPNTRRALKRLGITGDEVRARGEQVLALVSRSTRAKASGVRQGGGQAG